MLLTLLTNNVGILWVAMEGATLSTVLLVSLYRTPASLEAAWKYFILCGVGIAQALFGTILLYFAAEKVWAGAPRPAVDRALRGARPARADGAVARVRVPAGRIRHQGGVSAAA
jgi:formate hydrogenlyase subunit 3/multisubunit Na+/H+ antiporter MnhD subunit